MATKTAYDFEDRVALQCARYLQREEAKIHKHDPPSKVVGKGRFLRVQYLKNPFVDFHGHYRQAAQVIGHPELFPYSRPIAFDAKTTNRPVLAFGSPRGLKASQMAILEDEQAMGALTGVLWQHDDAVKWFSWEVIERDRSTRASLAWESGAIVAEKPFPDFLPVAVAEENSLP